MATSTQSNGLDELRTKAAGFLHDELTLAEKQGAKIVREVEKQAKKNVLATAGISFGVGFIAGKVMKLWR